MTGIENITSQIINDAKTKADKIVNGAKNDAQNIINEANVKAQNTLEDYTLKGQRSAQEIIKRYSSADEIECKKRVLGVKQEIIGKALKRAKAELFSVADEKYFKLLACLLKREARDEEGVILLNERDKKNITADFKALIDDLRLTVSDETLKSEGGFILKYGGIEINLLPDAVFDAYKDEFSDMLSGLLFE